MLTKTLTLASGKAVTISQLTVREVRAIDDKLKAANETHDERAQLDASLEGLAFSMNKASGGSGVTVDTLLDTITFGDMYDLNTALAELNQMTIAKAGEAKAE